MSEQPTSGRSATSGTATAGTDAPTDTGSGPSASSRARPVLEVGDASPTSTARDGAAGRSGPTSTERTSRGRTGRVRPIDEPAHPSTADVSATPVDAATASPPDTAVDLAVEPADTAIDDLSDIALAGRVTRSRAPRPRVRRVTRVIRHVDTWTVFKVSLVFNIVLYVSFLVSGVLIWNVAHGTGTVDNVERFMESFGWETFRFDGQQIFDAAWRIGLLLVVGLSGLAVLAATTFNLITDIVGGVRVTVLEEEVVARPSTPAPTSAARPAPDRGRSRRRSHSG